MTKGDWGRTMGTMMIGAILATTWAVAAPAQAQDPAAVRAAESVMRNAVGTANSVIERQIREARKARTDGGTMPAAAKPDEAPGETRPPAGAADAHAPARGPGTGTDGRAPD